ncbi:hypothetical protein Tsubulata_002686 [Turnera subulata]|uniref:KIB1-4 beta-propeller domain-containing protein n=1 Tax=Turnera subulata TaxID=218843 RepID=A0A9Q0F5I2_9ROSI|nr:hypothetical protein Tsubulata_002686 [Turnera subulata]
MSSRFSFLQGCTKLVSKRNRQYSSISTPIFPEKPGRRRDDDDDDCYHQPQPFTFVTNGVSHRGRDHRIINCGGCQHPLFESKRFDLGFLPCFRPRRKSGSGNRAVHVRIAATCNDMLLCHSTHPGDMARRVYYLCNPLTKKWLALPHFCPKCPFMKDGVAVGLVCYNEGNDFLVVRIHKKLAQVFSSETNKWLKMDVPEQHTRYGWERFHDIMFSWNGTLFYTDYEHIFAYNPLEPGRWHITATPRVEREECADSMVFGVCQGSLQLLERYRYQEEGFLRIWELKDYEKGEWSLKHDLFFDEIVTNDERLEYEVDTDNPHIDILGLDPNQEGIVYICHNIRRLGLGLYPPYCVPNQNFSCNLRTKEVKLLDANNKIPYIDERDIFYDGLTSWEKHNMFQYIIPKQPTHVPVLPPSGTN